MKKLIIVAIAIAMVGAGCKKDALQSSTTNPVKNNFAEKSRYLAASPASVLKGINWACPGDNFSDVTLVLSGLTSTDSYATVTAKTNSILTSLVTNTSANTVRIPVNYATTSSTWWNSYIGVIDEATSKGLNVIIGCWDGSNEDGVIDNTTNFWSMWQTVVTKYSGNSRVYFEIFNEPHGYTLSAWTTICAQWLANYPGVPQGRILVDGTSYAQDITGVGADSRFTNCLLSIHDYTFFTSSSLTTAYSWETRLAGNVGAYASRAVLTEFGDTMNSGINYTGAIGGSEDIAYIQGFTNQVLAAGMGSVYWPGIRTGDSYAMETITGTGNSLTLTNTNTSGLSRLQYGWGIGAGGTNTFYTGAYYRFLNVNSGQAMDVNGASTANGATIIQWPQNGGNNQQWVITSSGSGYYEITNNNSGLALDVSGASTANGAAIIQWPWNGGNNQQWQLTSAGNAIYVVTNRNSSEVVDVTSASITNGAAIIQWPLNNGANQHWQIIQE